MSKTDTYQVGITGDDGTRLSGSSTETGTTHVAVDTNLPASSTNVLVACAFTVANVQGCVLLSSVDMTIKTNSPGSPANTINLKAGIPYLWRASAGYNTLLFTVDVTAWYVTSTASGRLQALILTS
jgi:hypothetical protein